MRKRFLVKLGLVVLLSIVAIVLIPADKNYKIRISQTSSLPYKIFFSRKCCECPKKFSYVVFPSKHIEGQNFVKQIVGLPGDKIELSEEEICVDGKNCGSFQFWSPTLNIPLSPIEEAVIPEGYFYAYATHHKSFDSRYQEFGLVKIDDIEEIAWPIF